MVQEALQASLPLMSPMNLALRKLGGSAHACKGADPLAKLLLLLLIISFSIFDKLLVPYLKADYILACCPALMSARQTIYSLATALSGQQTKANRHVHALQHALLLTMRKAISFCTSDSMGAKANSIKSCKRLCPEMLSMLHLDSCKLCCGKIRPSRTTQGSIKSCPPIFDHALERLPIQVVCNVKLLQNLHIECAQVHYMLMHVEGPDVTHIKYFLLV